jgi:hypothetical protein
MAGEPSQRSQEQLPREQQEQQQEQLLDELPKTPYLFGFFLLIGCEASESDEKASANARRDARVTRITADLYRGVGIDPVTDEELDTIVYEKKLTLTNGKIRLDIEPPLSLDDLVSSVLNFEMKRRIGPATNTSHVVFRGFRKLNDGSFTVRWITLARADQRQPVGTTLEDAFSDNDGNPADSPDTFEVE